jgi:thiol-disulfide isomerase/thioredoxin
VAGKQKRQETAAAPRKRGGIRSALIIVGVVLALFAIVLAKSMAGSGSPQVDAAGTGAPAGASGSTSSLTSVHNDAGADYEAARKTGKPIYLLFHSLTCDPCVEISGIADKVVPRYRGKIAFVNAITDDVSAQQLASKFPFQYIPTSFFLKPDGTVVDSYTGVLSEADMKARLDKLAAQ